MDFAVSPEIEMLRNTVREFVARDFPRSVQREVDEQGRFPQEVFEKMGELGLFSLPIAEEYGGLGGNVFDVCLVLEELGRQAFDAALMYLMLVSFGAKTIGLYGTEEQKADLLPKIARGELKFSLGVTEPNAGMDSLATETFAEPDGDGFVINGRKMFCTGAHISDYTVIMARTKRDVVKKSDGISLFLVPRETRGFDKYPVKHICYPALHSTEVVLDDVWVPRENVLGQLHRGWHHLVASLNVERLTVAASCVGLAQAAFEDALEYAKQRVVFGRPIGQFQAIHHYLADMATAVEQARWLTRYAAWREAKGLPCVTEANMAKVNAAEVAVQVTGRGMQILGGYAFTLEYDMQRYWRNAKFFQAGPITNEMAKNAIGVSLGLPKSY